MKNLLLATVATLALGGFAMSPALAAEGGIPGGPEGQGSPEGAASHDNAHGGNDTAESASQDRSGGNGTGNAGTPGNDGGSNPE